MTESVFNDGRDILYGDHPLDLGKPTINEFATEANISSPNARV